MKIASLQKFLAFIIIPLTFIGCSQNPPQSTNLPEKSISKLKVTASFYPLYELAREIGKMNVEAKNLVPAGVEPHDYEPTPQDIKNLLDADLVIINGAGLETWIEKIFPSNQSKLLNMANFVNSESVDPHFWLNPEIFEQEAQVVAERLIALDPKNQSSYKANLQSYNAQLKNLQKNYQDGLAKCQLRTIVTNHDAFGHLGKKYNFEIISISGVSPEDEPSAQKLAKISNIVKEQKIQYILTESLLSPKYAETIARETGAKTLELNPLEGLTDEQVTQGENYVTVMNRNLQTLKIALNCA